MELGIPNGDMYAMGAKVYLIGLEDGRPVIKATEEGKNNWKTEFKIDTSRTYKRGVSTMENGRLYYYLLENGSGDKRPIHVLRFNMVGTTQ
jgi:hypothetical protein